MENVNKSQGIGIGGTETDGAALASLLLVLEDMSKKWPDDGTFRLPQAIEALGAIIETLAPLIEVTLLRASEGNYVKDAPAIEQLRALNSALSDLRRAGRAHPELEPTSSKGSSILRRDEEELQEAIVGAVAVIQTVKGYKTRKEAEQFVVRKLKLKYKGQTLGQKQLADMSRAVKKRANKLGESR